ncbi:hypothetical protein KO506_01775 [Polaribacter vadi]|uniref:hypothetical protein n=1 Tax=Polaribacter TaxID=52959 RepID=UPI001C088EF8|nr:MULTISPECIES: hypothetical protein [Polaribacter]MBU3010127.1 hypothetical protein [Polaribacter vadi]MDO6739934.1 hypothetical protein [Polaribacter sp. 1_MG-2023]
MNQLTKFIERNGSGKKVLLLFILTNLIYAFMLMVTIPNTMIFSDGMKLLDMMPTGYSFDYVNNLLNTLGTKGRKIYLTNQIPVDMIYPLFFGVSYSLIMAYFLKKINKLNSTYKYLCLLPLLAGIADYFENFGIIIMLNNYQNLTEVLVSTTNIFSIIKSFATTIFFVLLLIILITVGINYFKNIKT